MDDPAEAPKGSTCVSELEGAELDAAVARAEGVAVEWKRGHLFSVADGILYRPSSHWARGGPIIERERIDIVFTLREPEDDPRESPVWHARCIGSTYDDSSLPEGEGPTPLIAAMRAYVASKQ